MNRITRELTEAERAELVRKRRLIADELPDLAIRDHRRHEAALEKTLSGAVRRSIHSSGQSVDHLAKRIGIDPAILDDFLTGERPLGSDILDRIAQELQCEATLAPCG